jgi:hypothetical protein
MNINLVRTAFTKLASHIDTIEAVAEQVPPSSGEVLVILRSILTDEEIRAFGSCLASRGRLRADLETHVGLRLPKPRLASERKVFFPFGTNTSSKLRAWITRAIHNDQQEEEEKGEVVLAPPLAHVRESSPKYHIVIF